MNGKLMLYVCSRTGQKVWAKTVRELCHKVGLAKGTAKRMYRDVDGTTVHVGYVCGQYWFTAYVPYVKAI